MPAGAHTHTVPPTHTSGYVEHCHLPSARLGTVVTTGRDEVLELEKWLDANAPPAVEEPTILSQGSYFGAALQPSTFLYDSVFSSRGDSIMPPPAEELSQHHRYQDTTPVATPRARDQAVMDDVAVVQALDSSPVASTPTAGGRDGDNGGRGSEGDVLAAAAALLHHVSAAKAAGEGDGNDDGEGELIGTMELAQRQRVHLEREPPTAPPTSARQAEEEEEAEGSRTDVLGPLQQDSMLTDNTAPYADIMQDRLARFRKVSSGATRVVRQQHAQCMVTTVECVNGCAGTRGVLCRLCGTHTPSERWMCRTWSPACSVCASVV